jgi:hypothetical protein
MINSGVTKEWGYDVKLNSSFKKASQSKVVKAAHRGTLAVVTISVTLELKHILIE